jgi:4-amino-4-deoxy-L-arabinose transferase-like glycosyltransferase
MLLIGISLGRLPWYAIIILYLIAFSLSGAYHTECKNLNSERDGGLLVIYGFTFIFVLINLQQEEGWHNYHVRCYWLYQLLVTFILSGFYASELKSKNLPFEDYISFVISIILIVSDAQRSSVWRSVAKASAERPDFAERERTLERLTPER